MSAVNVALVVGVFARVFVVWLVAAGEDQRRQALTAHARAVAGHVTVQQDARIQQAQQVGDIAAGLHQRFGIVMRQLGKTGRSMNTAVNSSNALIGSLESRVLPQLRKLAKLSILAHGTQRPQAQTIEAQTLAFRTHRT